jgi:hypothetical protein
MGNIFWKIIDNELSKKLETSGTILPYFSILIVITAILFISKVLV